MCEYILIIFIKNTKIKERKDTINSNLKYFIFQIIMDDLIFIKSNELFIQPEKKWFDNKVKILI